MKRRLLKDIICDFCPTPIETSASPYFYLLAKTRFLVASATATEHLGAQVEAVDEPVYLTICSACHHKVASAIGALVEEGRGKGK